MKIKLLSVFAFFLGLGLAIGQNLTIIPGDTVSTTDPIFRKAKTELINNAGHSITLFWRKTVENVPVDWDESGVCDDFGCYQKDTGRIILESGDTSAFDALFFTNSISGNGNLEVEVFDMDDSSNTNAIVVFMGEFVYQTNGMEMPTTLERNKFLVSPNPAKDFVNIITNNTELENIEIFNVLGNKIAEYSAGTASVNTIPIHDLKKGMYLIRFTGQDDKVLQTQSFVKTN